jgi:ligand-binding sensor domain-containing protein/DNA-binding response OmpR family regulator/nitrogen-specific signal transduction histidine kinase
MRKTIAILLLFCIISIHAYSFPVRHLGIESGLSNNYIVDITQDGEGCIWIATESGLNRFDGYNFTTYTTRNSDLVSNELNALLFDEKQNTLWIGTQRDGISILDLKKQTFSNLTMNEGLITNDVTRLSQASDGGIWITHYHVGVEHYNTETGELTLYGNPNIEGMKSLNWCSRDDRNGHLYIGHALDGLSIINIHNKTVQNLRHDTENPQSLPGNSVRTICIDRFNNIWLGTDQGLALYDPQTETFITFKHNPDNPRSLGSNSIFSICEMQDGTLWISTDMAGISILNLNNLTLRGVHDIEFTNIPVTDEQNRLASTNILRLFQDSFKNIWIGHRQKGIDFISQIQPAFQSIPIQNNFENDQIWSMYLDITNQLWIGKDREINVFKDGKFKKKIDISSYLSRSHRYVSLIKGDTKENLWLGIYRGGLLRMNVNTCQVQQLPTHLFDNLNVRDIFEDKKGKIWIATERGLYSFLNNKYEYEEKINDVLEDKVIYSITGDEQENLWVGTFGKGIHIFNKENQLLAKHSKSTGFCSNAINSLYKDTKERIWAATREGLACINSRTFSEFSVYDDKQEIENTHIRAICEDQSGKIWVSTSVGVSLLDQQKNRFVNFNYKDGVSTGDFINGSAYLASDGTLFFASLNGICSCNPINLNKEFKLTPVKIISFQGYNKNVGEQSGEIITPSGKGEIEIPYNWNSFKITFAIPNFSQSELVEYTYNMEGLENIWYNSQGENQVTFRNIPPGRYTFKVKARLKNQEWDEDTFANLPVHIHPPIWLAWYAKLFYFFVLCFIGYVFIRSYKNKLELKTSLELEKRNSQNKQELNEERLRFYTNITHELRTPLTLILGPLEDLATDVNLPKSFKKRVHTIRDSTIRLLNLVNQLLEFRKTETQNKQLMISKGDLESLVTEIGLRYKELNQNSNVTFHIAVETKETALYYDTDMISTILNNLISNALKYTPKGEIKVAMRSTQSHDEKYTEIEVLDTGYGISPEDLPHIFDRYYQAKGKHQASGTGIGLALVKSLCELHEGVLEVQSVLSKGTCFTLRLLTENNYSYALHATDKRSDFELTDMQEENHEGEENNSALPIVLIVEDNTSIREYIKDSLSDNYRAITATNGKEGLTLAQQQIPNIIVSDIMMPEMDGLEFCSLIKNDIRTSHIPVILLTAKDSMQNREEGYESGADSYLTKPFSAKLLKSRLKNLLESRRQLAVQTTSFMKNDHLEETGKKLFDIKISLLDKRFLGKLTSVIEENLDLPTLDVAFLRERMFMSSSTFYRKVKGLTNLSPNEFVRKIRLQKGAKLLLAGQYNVSEVAYMIGFNDAAYFRTCFKDEYGMTPTEYIQKNNMS